MKTVIQCAQLIIDATAGLAAQKPDWAVDVRVTCLVSTPDMFGSEICLYIDDEYFRRQISEENTQYTVKERIKGNSLARRWNLRIPDGFQELGFRVFMPDPDDGDYGSEWWFFGELD